MKLPRPIKLALLALTLWPILYVLAIIVAMPSFPEAYFDVLADVHLATTVLSLGLYAFYVVDLFKTASVPRDMKALWGVALLIGSYVTMVVYWFKHIWPEPAAWPLDSVITRDSIERA